MKTEIARWINDSKDSFSPPVCNKLLHGNQLKVMFVGGPNQRKDYHLECGEELIRLLISIVMLLSHGNAVVESGFSVNAQVLVENLTEESVVALRNVYDGIKQVGGTQSKHKELFYQHEGEMTLKVVEQGQFKDININKGQMYLLPSKLYHSPQRTSDSVGMVIERLRSKLELDSLRYFLDDGSLDALYQRWFYCDDLVKDLPPVINNFMQSNAYSTGMVSSDSFEGEGAYSVDLQQESGEPIVLDDWLQANKHEIISKGYKNIFDTSKFNTKVVMHGMGNYAFLGEMNAEVFIWQLTGKSTISENNADITLKAGETLLINAEKLSSLMIRDAESFCFSVRMPTPSQLI